MTTEETRTDTAPIPGNAYLKLAVYYVIVALANYGLLIAFPLLQKAFSAQQLRRLLGRELADIGIGTQTEFGDTGVAGLIGIDQLPNAFEGPCL